MLGPTFFARNRFAASRGGSWLAVVAGLVLLATFVIRPAAGAAAAFADPDRPYHTAVAVEANGVARTDKPVEVKLNFTPLLTAAGAAGAFDPASLRVVEVDGGGALLDGAVPFQFDKASDYNATSRARGTLVFLMGGNTAAAATRHYQVWFDVTGNGYTAPVFPGRVALTEQQYRGYASYRIVTDNGEYYYHKPGGGFASLIDSGSRDWIDWNTASGGAGDFRGIPNLINPGSGGYFHPGRNVVNTVLVDKGPLKASFKSAGGGWETLWEVFPGYARLTVTKSGGPAYWFLYEGTPGGTLDTQDIVVRSNGTQNPALNNANASDEWIGDLAGDEWVYVGDPAVGRSLFLAHHESDSVVDSYKPDNGGEMTIFGFGRSGNAMYLSAVPQQFTVGLAGSTGFNAVKGAVENAYKPLVVTGGNDNDVDPGPTTCPGGTLDVYLSTKSGGSLTFTPAGGSTQTLAYADEDVLRYQAATCAWSKPFDGTDAGLPGTANVDALEVVGDDYYLSFLAPVTIPAAVSSTGASYTADDSDIVVYNAGTGKFTLLYDMSLAQYGLSTNYEDVDAIAFDGDGNLVVSTVGAYAVPGAGKGPDEDLLRWTGTTWERLFDGSQVGLGAEDINGASIGAGATVYLSVLDAFSVKGLNGSTAKGDGKDIFACAGGTRGPADPTTCEYSNLWDAAAYGLPVIDGLDVVTP